VLSDDEVAGLWRSAPALGRCFEGFFKLLLLTGQRREEVAGLEWSELNRSAREWWLPRYRTKNAKEQLVPLSNPAIEVLDFIAGGVSWPKAGLVFTTTGRTPISGFSKAKARLDAMLASEMPSPTGSNPWRAHDIRRTLATGLQRLGVRFEVTEAVLNHVSGSRSGVAGVYQRYDWAEEKRDALDNWGSYVLKLVGEYDVCSQQS
jgi:integrase